MSQSGVEVMEAGDLVSERGDAGGWAEFGRSTLTATNIQTIWRLESGLRCERSGSRYAVIGSWLEEGKSGNGSRLAVDAGGLPKVELPAYLAATKWSRCAVVKGDVAVPSYPWHWSADIRIASPPECQLPRGREVRPWGVSLQECVVPEIVVGRECGCARVDVSVAWRG